MKPRARLVARGSTNGVNTVYLYRFFAPFCLPCSLVQPAVTEPDLPSAAEFPIAPPVPRKGRGAVTNVQGRYEVDQREAVDDGWLATPEEGEAPKALRTQVFEERAKSILTRNASPDIPFSVSLNPYRGCEHVMRH